MLRECASHERELLHEGDSIGKKRGDKISDDLVVRILIPFISGNAKKSPKQMGP
jgi:hypothetical protein